MGFKCSKCGACCILAGEILKNVTNFPYSFDKDGKCEMYDPVKGCKVYKNRPDVCNVEKMYDGINKEFPIEKQTYYDIASMKCNSYMDKLNIDKSFRLKL